MTAATGSGTEVFRDRPAFYLASLSNVRIRFGWTQVAYFAIFAAAIGLRFWDLGGQALHHDESIHAQWSWRLTQGDYTHDPIFHGPFYYHVQGLVFLYYDGTQWRDSWDSTTADQTTGLTNTLPRAIKVQIQIASATGGPSLSQATPMELVVPLFVQARTNQTQQSTGGQQQNAGGGR